MICLNAGYRARLEGFDSGVFQRDNSDTYLLTRFRMGALIKPNPWLHVYTELQDATAFWKDQPRAPPYQSTWDLRRAYVDLGDFEHGPISIRVGRQDLNFGDGRLVGTSFWRNASRGYDAAMLMVRRNGIRVSAFSASQVMPFTNGLSHHQQGNNIHGLYGQFRNVIPRSDLEPYMFWRLAPSVKTEARQSDRIRRKRQNPRLGLDRRRGLHISHAADETTIVRRIQFRFRRPESQRRLARDFRSALPEHSRP